MQNGAKSIALVVNGLIGVGFEITKDDDFVFCVCPNNAILEEKDDCKRNTLFAWWASKMAIELGIPTRFWIEGGNLLWKPKATRWVPMTQTSD